MEKKKRIQMTCLLFVTVFLLSSAVTDGYLANENTLKAANEEDAKTEMEGIKEQESKERTVALNEQKEPDTTKKPEEMDSEENSEKEQKEEQQQEEQKESEKESKLKKENEEEKTDFVIADVDTSLNIRKDPSTDAEIVGKLYEGAKADIIKKEGEWTYIKSGSVTGYVSSDYLAFDEEARKKAEEYGELTATIEADALRIRKTPELDGKVLDLAEKGSDLLVNEDEAQPGWVAVWYGDDTYGYVSEDYVSVELKLKEAISIEEERRLLEEQRQKEQAASYAATSNNQQVTTSSSSNYRANRSPISVSNEEAYLLATVVYMEAGSESYEGKLAVANVVINRLLSGIWGNTISSVVYAPGQFSGANTGLLQKYLNQGPNSGSIQAANEALAGVNNIGSYMSFLQTRIANFSAYSSYTIIGNHCFYNR